MLLPASPVPVAQATFSPAELLFPSIGVTAVVAPVGTVTAPAPFLGGQMVSTFAVPPDASSVGWWADGPLVGAPGMAILLGHTQVGGGYAVFNRLGELRPGDEVSVEGQAGDSPVSFHVTRVITDVPKRQPDALQRVLSENEQSAQLALITCGGVFDEAVDASEANIVVFAART
jgi:hypothetical protein